LSIVAILAVGFVLFAAITIVLTGAGKPPATDTQAEYAAALARLRFPPGASPRPVDPAGLQSGNVYEPGTGAIDAVNAWFCAWTIYWRDERTGNPTAAAHALKELADAYPDGLFWQSLAVADGKDLKGEVDRAIAGDGAALLREIDDFGCTR
jgi:hypothetical protein